MNDEWKNYETMWASRFRENLWCVTKGLSISEISRMSGLDKSSITHYLSGRTIPSAWSCVCLARGLGVPITDIIDYFY